MYYYVRLTEIDVTTRLLWSSSTGWSSDNNKIEATQSATLGDAGPPDYASSSMVFITVTVGLTFLLITIIFIVIIIRWFRKWRFVQYDYDNYYDYDYYYYY